VAGEEGKQGNPKGQASNKHIPWRAYHYPHTSWTVKKANSKATAGKQEAQAKKERRVCQLFSAFSWNLTRAAIVRTNKKWWDSFQVHKSKLTSFCCCSWRMILSTDSMGYQRPTTATGKGRRGEETGAHLVLLLQLSHESAARQPGLSKDNNSHRQRKKGGEMGAHHFLLVQLSHDTVTKQHGLLKG